METFTEALPAPSFADDEPLLIEAARQNPEAFDALYCRYLNPVYRYLFSRVQNQADAEDLTAQVFIEVLEGLARYRDRGTFAAWLFTIARRRAIDHPGANVRSSPWTKITNTPTDLIPHPTSGKRTPLSPAQTSANPQDDDRDCSVSVSP
ncbi:MAG: RNA polymerase sigma factor [Anaerolineales bacterium]|nr:RNA polymerase sigma factor [Anaerolineales bacterium]